MCSHLLRASLRYARIPQRSLSTTPASAKNLVLDQKLRQEIHPKIGSREIVGFGNSGAANYIDMGDFPAPAIRFKEDSPEILKLRAKEKKDWKNMTLQEKKELYRASFCQTYAEMGAPNAEWKKIMSIVLLCCSLGLWLQFFIKRYVYEPLTPEFEEEFQEVLLRRMILEHQGPVDGIASKWDYDKMRWKVEKSAFRKWLDKWRKLPELAQK